MHIGPALCAGEGVRASSKPEIGFAPPVFQIMPRGKARLGPVGDFILLIASGSKPALRQSIEIGHQLLVRQLPGTVARAAFEDLQAETAAFIDFHDVGGDVLGRQGDQFLK